MKSALKYVDEADKALGIAGMAISLVACDGEDFLAAVSIVDGEDSLDMSDEFFFNGNQEFSAKLAWNEMLKQFQLTAGMLLGNVMCRAYAAGHSPSRDTLDAVRRLIREEGSEHCSLDRDEADAIYEKDYDYYSRLFAHPTVAEVARNFASVLRTRRRLNAAEVLDNLRRLNSL